MTHPAFRAPLPQAGGELKAIHLKWTYPIA
jgi:hypothetical protein